MNLRDYEAFASCDWGFNQFGCLLWWVALSDGHLHIAREYKFKGQNAEQVATTVRTMTKELGIKRLRYIACDPAMKAKTGHARGESIMETLQRRGLPMRPSDNARVQGWARVHELLQEAPDGIPWLTVEPECKYLIRSMGGAQSDKNDPDDVDTDSDDHALDALRYGAMSRPSPTRFADRARFSPTSAGSLLNAAIASRSQRPVVGATAVRGR